MIVNPAIHSTHTHTALKSQFPFIWISKLNEQQQMNDVKVDSLRFKAFLPLQGGRGLDIEGRWEGLFTGRAAWRHLSSLTYLHHQGSKPASHASWTWWTLDPGSSSGPCDAKRPSWWWCPGDACRGGMQTKVRGRCPCDEQRKNVQIRGDKLKLQPDQLYSHSDHTDQSTTGESWV